MNFLNRGLKVGNNSLEELASKGDSCGNLLSLVNSSKTVKGLYASNYYISMDFFNTYTCNQLHYFGIKCIKV